jgi:hypothetical protein
LRCEGLGRSVKDRDDDDDDDDNDGVVERDNKEERAGGKDI